MKPYNGKVICSIGRSCVRMEIRGRPEPVTVPCTHCGGQSGLVFFKIYRVIGKKEYSTMLTNEYLKRVYEG